VEVRGGVGKESCDGGVGEMGDGRCGGLWLRAECLHPATYWNVPACMLLARLQKAGREKGSERERERNGPSLKAWEDEGCSRVTASPLP
jgi:hypothetical protein